MWLTDLLPAQPKTPGESASPYLEEPPKGKTAPVNAVDTDDPTCHKPGQPGACRQRLTSPGQAGAVDWGTLATWKDEFPHLRPCPQAKNKIGDWLWVNRSHCQGCPWAMAKTARPLQ